MVLPDEPPQQPLIGQNTVPSQLQAACPGRNYQRCFYNQLSQRYPVTQFRAGSLLTGCDEKAIRKSRRPPSRVCTAPNMVQHTLGKLSLCPSHAHSSAHGHVSNGSTAEKQAYLRCNSSAADIQASAVLLLGVPSSPTETGAERRAAIRASWLQDERVGVSVVICFLLSSQTPEEQLQPMRSEHAQYGLLCTAPHQATPHHTTPHHIP